MRQALLEATPDAMVVADESGRISLVNEQAVRLFGYSREDLVGSPVERLMPHRYRGSHAAHRRHFAEVPAARSMGSGLELWAERADGTQLPVEISLSPVRLADRTFVAAAIRDVTDRQRAQAELRRRASQQRAIAALGMESFEEHDLQEFLTEACQQLRRALEVDYTKVFELQPEQDSLLLRAGAGWKGGVVGTTRIGTGADSLAGFALSNDEPIVVHDAREERRFRVPEFLREHNVSSSVTTIIYGHGRPYGVLGADSVKKRQFTPEDVDVLQAIANLIGNVIEHRRVNEALQRANLERTQELQRLKRELEEFLNSLAHELRTPLRGIHGYSTVLREETVAGSGLSQDYLGRIQVGAARLGQLMDDLLMLSQVSFTPVRPSVLDLSRIAREKIQELEEAEPERQVRVGIEDELTAVGDPHLLDLALGALLDNAWKFTRPCEVARIYLGESRSDNGEAVYFVRDNGVGFDLRYAQRLFTPFGRIASDEFEGRGTGLALVRRIMDRHGGRVWAEGQPGQGATFYFSLPSEP